MKIGKYGEAITAWNHEKRIYIEDIQFKPGIKPMIGAVITTEMLADPLVWKVATALFKESMGPGYNLEDREPDIQDHWYTKAERIIKIVKEGLEE